MIKICNKIKSFFSNKHNRNRFLTICIIMLFFFVILLSPTFAQLMPIKSVTIQSENLSYESEEEGSWQITKSAEWISKGKARITIEVDSIIKTNNKYTDIVLVLDTSGSMNGERLDKVKMDTINLINEIVPEGNNVALITFSDSSEIITDFTNDSETLINYINSLEAFGNTNYYQALVNVDTILKTYQKEETRDCVVLFLTDGYPNIDSPNEIGQYEYLKSTYPYLMINGIQYEMGEEVLEPLEVITDNQYIAYVKDLEQFLYKASVSPIKYDKFEIVDYIEDEYFNVDDINSINTTIGKYSLDDNKIIWNIDEVTSGQTFTMTIDISLNEELVGVGGIYSINEKIEINSVIEGSIEEVTSTLTPILADNYSVIYDWNGPDDCIVTGVPKTTKVSVFDTVSISKEEPSCEGYRFKGWNLVSNETEMINSEYFIMPESDVTLRATWSKLSLDKAMDGKVSQVQSLYQMMADNSVPDNVASEFVTSSTGIRFNWISGDTNGKGIYQAVKLEGEDTPIYYYRGLVTNNNLIFANFCWKIVRTTETKGVKLIYNGIPNEDGSCTATGEGASIGNSAFNLYGDSMAYNGYMYGNIYTISTKRSDIDGLGEKKSTFYSNVSTTNYIYSKSVTYGELEDGTYGYTLVDGENRIWSDTYSVGDYNRYLYTCLSETESTCEEVYFTTKRTGSYYMYNVSFTGGETASEIFSKEIAYGNDVLYDEETGMYTLQTTMTSKIGDWPTDYLTIGGENGYHYTCFNGNVICEKVNYINYIDSSSIVYTELTNGIKIEEAVKQMTVESEHKTDSVIKMYLDAWYENNMKIYTDKLEDTVWCNDRTIDTYGGWDKDNSTIDSYQLNYKARQGYFNEKMVLSCHNKHDAYTVDDTINGNGDLIYPVGLLTVDEITYAGHHGDSYYLCTGESWWTMSPYSFHQSNIYNFSMYPTGGLSTSIPGKKRGVRPSISLKAGTRSVDGDGTPQDPYIVE